MPVRDKLAKEYPYVVREIGTNGVYQYEMKRFPTHTTVRPLWDIENMDLCASCRAELKVWIANGKGEE